MQLHFEKSSNMYGKMLAKNQEYFLLILHFKYLSPSQGSNAVSGIGTSFVTCSSKIHNYIVPTISFPLTIEIIPILFSGQNHLPIDLVKKFFSKY